MQRMKGHRPKKRGEMKGDATVGSAKRCAPSKDAAKPPVTTPVSTLETHLGYWLRAVSNHVSYAFQEKVEQHGVTVAEWVILRACFGHTSVKPSQLAAELGLTRGTVSKLVTRLLEKKLLVRREDATDGRSQLLSLEKKGRALVPQLARLADKNDAEAFDFLDGRRRAELLDLLQKIAEHHGLTGAPLE